MKTVLCLVTLTMALCAIVQAVPQQKYTTKYDNVDIDSILRSDRLLRNYVNCLLDKGKCSPDGQELKSHLGDALKTNCSKCSDRQKVNSKKMIRYLIDNKREWWNALEAKYDPTGTYRKQHEAELKQKH